MVSAFATANGVVMGQVKTDSKSNEITAIPDLLKRLDIKGCLITIDAMGCQHKITRIIVDKGADHLIAVKGNQKRLLDSIKRAFLSAHKTTDLHIEKGHSRVEACEYHVLDAADIAKAYPNWADSKTMGMAINYQHNGQKDSLEYRYYISSAKLTTEQFGIVVVDRSRVKQISLNFLCTAASFTVANRSRGFVVLYPCFAGQTLPTHL
jgi:predicted transposase YbfD/YdcC